MWNKVSAKYYKFYVKVFQSSKLLKLNIWHKMLFAISRIFILTAETCFDATFIPDNQDSVMC